MIIPIWQQLFQSTHQLAKEVGLQLGDVATHTGTLDPMAQGMVVVLTGDDRFLKGKLEWQKTYDFSILWGVKTDTGDQLGLIEATDIVLPDIESIKQVLERFPLRYDQQVPDFSARRWQGSSSFDAARKDIKLPLKTRAVTLEKLSLLGFEYLTASQVLAKQSHAVHQVHGDFRQAKVGQSWHLTLTQFSDDTQLLITHHRVLTSPGTYIRQLVHDLASELNAPATTWAITRIKNGPYTREDVATA